MSHAEIRELVKQSQSFVRTNQFRVEFTLPSGLKEFDIRRLSPNCHTAKIPGYSIENYTHAISGAPETQHAATTKYVEASFGFYQSKDFHEFDVFDEWRKIIVDTETGKLGYFNDYTTSIYVIPLLSNDRRLRTIELLDCKPTTMGETDLSFKSQNEIAELTVSMSYTRYRTVT